MRDRAAAVATAILQIVAESLRDWLHGRPHEIATARTEIEALLRDEFCENARDARDEIAPD